MLKSINAILLFVSDIKKSADFYRELGFEVNLPNDRMAEAKLNNFVLQLIDKNQVVQEPAFQKEAATEPKGMGVFIYVEVDDVDKHFADLKSKNIKSTEPRDWPWGNREFVAKDPDGYKLVFYKRLK